MTGWDLKAVWLFFFVDRVFIEASVSVKKPIKPSVLWEASSLLMHGCILHDLDDGLAGVVLNKNCTICIFSQVFFSYLISPLLIPSFWLRQPCIFYFCHCIHNLTSCYLAQSHLLHSTHPHSRGLALQVTWWPHYCLCHKNITQYIL